MNAIREPLDALRVPLAGTVLIEASAGTGKTHTITTLFIRLVVEQGIAVGQILVVTFTEAATTELRERIRRRLRVAIEALSGLATPHDPELARFAASAESTDVYLARAEAALRELDLAAISTIHAFCLRALQEHAFESGAAFGLELMPDTSLLVDELAEDYWTAKVCELPRSLYSLRKGRFELGTARSVVSALARRPVDVPVLPAPDDGEPTPDRDAVLAAFATARRAWESARESVRTQLLDKTIMNQRSYAAAAVEGWCTELDDWFAGDSPEENTPFDALAKLSPDAIAKGTKGGNKPPKHAVFREFEELRELVHQFSTTFHRGLRLGAVDYVRRELPARKAALRVQSFEDLLFALDGALRGPRASALRERIVSLFRVALIDEFQDTDPVQYRIFRTLFHEQGGALMLVGDPKQSIYAFRGADVFSYAHAANAAANAYTLGENRRSDPSLVRAVNTVFSRPRAPFLIDAIGFHPVAAHHAKDRLTHPRGQAPFEILFVPRPEDASLAKGQLNQELPCPVAAEIARFLASDAKIGAERVRPGDVAVLTRTNAQARLVQAELRKLRIPTALQSDETVFASSEAADVELLLRAVLQPTRNGAVRAALSTAVAGVSANELAELDTNERAWDRWSEKFREWQLHWDEHGFVHAYRRMLSELEVEKRLLTFVDGERRVTNLIHLGELLHGVATRERLGRTALVRWLQLTRAQDEKASELGTEAAELRLESDAHAVQLLTIHKSKGLEFPVVYCPFLFDVRLPKKGDVAIDFHDPDDAFTLKIDVDPEDKGTSLKWKKREILAENQRLLYVALTRAKHRCSVIWGSFSRAEHSALAYALHQPGASDDGADRQQKTAERYKGLDDGELRADLAALAKASGGTIAIVDLDLSAAGPPYEPPAMTGAITLAARTFERKRVDLSFRMGSFSTLSRREPGGATHLDLTALGQDRDGVEDLVGVAPSVVEPGTPVILHAFPRGAKAGTMLHEVLEDHDFTSSEAAELRALIATKLTAAGYSDEEWGTTLASGIEAMLDAPLDDKGLRLASIPRAKRLDELEFVFPVARGNDMLTAKRLADALDAHPGGMTPPGYAARLRSLTFPPLHGFLKGFIDLVFEHEGRFYVVDYKSNHLGPMPEDYRSAALVQAMLHHDYFLQYHLYVVAVHRWLSRRLRDYDYERHFGGVFYLFARGMSAKHPGMGVFVDRPSFARTDALSRVLEGVR